MTTYVLIPGAGGESSYWSLVAARLRASGDAVISPDLPADDPAAHLADYADVVVSASNGGGDGGAVVVGQSLGGFCAPLVAERIGARRIDLVCPMIPLPGETAGDWWTTSGQDRASRAADLAAGRDPDRPFDVEELFLHDVPREVLTGALGRPPRDQSGTPMGDPWPLRSWPAIPTRVLAGRDDRLLPLAFVRTLARERLGVEADVIESGHLPALAAPDALVDWLRGG
jgi:pimeloyl-ACP methyl ester carboxylesterase